MFSATEWKAQKRGCRLAWSRLVDLGSIDPGSNPGSPIIGSEPFQVWGRAAPLSDLNSNRLFTNFWRKLYIMADIDVLW